MKIKDILTLIESFAPLGYQENYDNAGLIVGERETGVTGAVICLDVTERIIEEAVEKGANLVISHHPIVFHPIKSLNARNYVERTVMKAIRNNIAIYAAHTNLDVVNGGINTRIAEKLGLENIRILHTKKDDLFKIVVFSPESHGSEVRKAMGEAGAGSIGNYDFCTFNIEGTGTFRARSGALPYVGRVGEIHSEKEIRTESILPAHLIGKVISAVRAVHPYEEMAYDIYPLRMDNPLVGSGAIGEFPEPIPAAEFLRLVKGVFGIGALRYSDPLNKIIKRVALCGGAGSFLLENAVAAGADAFLTADLKYDTFFAAEKRILLADFGHFESEICAVDILYNIVTKKIPNFVLHKSDFCHNPINYLV